MMNTQVLIIGAGPTGLMAANQLNRFGIDFIIIDAKDGPTAQSRAIAVTSRSLEIYQQMGLAEIILEQGARINSFCVYSEGKQKAEVKIGEIGKGLSDFSFMLAFEQSKNEDLLYRNLKIHGKDVQWETEFIELKENENGIQASVKKNGDAFSINAQYVIACDGARSPVRHQLNFKFDGGTYENKFFVADATVKWNLEYDRLIVTPSYKNFCAFFPMKGERYYRVLGTLPKEYFNNENVSFKDIEKVVAGNLQLPVTFEKVNWFSIYKLHHRCVDNFNKGRIFLAGDSAHIHSPAGGQGMNTGLQDAYNLAWKLAFVLKKYANKDLLQTYTEERLPFAQWLMKFTDRAFSLMTSDNWFIARFRKYIVLNLMGMVVSFKKFRPNIFKTVSQIKYSHYGKFLSSSNSSQKLLFRSGDRLPYIQEADSGKKFYDLFTAASFHLLHIGKSQLSEEVLEKVKRTFPFPVKIVENDLSDSWKNLGVEKDLFILVRPDNYIAYMTDSFDEAEMKEYLKKYFRV
jgi:2-polyprenyl-6-methoxyphenol hydroxylase-like FAD-dependent oxidoreductase